MRPPQVAEFFLQSTGRCKRVEGSYRARTEAPGQKRSPNELVRSEYDREHRNDGPDGGGVVSFFDCRCHVGAEPRQLDVLVQNRDCLTLGHKEPTASKRHHGIPDQAMHRRRYLERSEPLPGREPKVGCSLLQIIRDGDHRMVKAKRHIPNLARKNRKDARAFYSKQAPRKESHKARNRDRQKPEDWDGL